MLTINHITYLIHNSLTISTEPLYMTFEYIYPTIKQSSTDRSVLKNYGSIFVSFPISLLYSGSNIMNEKNAYM